MALLAALIDNVKKSMLLKSIPNSRRMRKLSLSKNKLTSVFYASVHVLLLTMNLVIISSKWSAVTLGYIASLIHSYFDNQL